MTSSKLVQSYLEKAAIRIKALEFLHQQRGYSDVIREAQECVELLLKAVLRQIGIESPKTHDVSHVLNQNKDYLPPLLKKNLDEIVAISRSLRKERELAFYGTEDWIPTEEYTEKDSSEAIQKAKKVFKLVHASLR